MPASKIFSIVLLGLFVTASVVANDRPNVVVILTDDQGWGDLSLHGNKNLSTPNIDSLGKIGARFDRFYVCPVCAPTRAEFLTGRYHPRGGVRGVTTGEERLDLDEKTIAEHFKAAGYATAAFGKWHNGMQHPYHPNARGFDEFYGYCSGHWGDYFSPQLERNGRWGEGNGYLVDDFTDKALEFIEDHVTEEFFLYLPLPTPHSPMQVPQKYWDRFKDKKLQNKSLEPNKEDQDFTRAAMAMVECIDDNVGRVLNKLDELSLSKNTIVVFFCDNGPNSNRWNGGMKGKKGSTDEGGVRSPLFISWPDKIRSGRLVLQISGAIDLLPTLTDLADVPMIGGKALDGISLEPLLSGRTSAIPDRMIFSYWNNRVSVRTQHFRLDNKGNLFDMLVDPGQDNPANARLSEVADELKLHVAAWKSEVLRDFSETDDRPFTVGDPRFPSTTLPARDGTPHGMIERSAKAPNCSYFTNWKTKSDSMTWDVDVLAAGNFRVDLYYACKDTSVGSEIEFSAGRRTISELISKANDPPAVGPEHDRVKRVTQSPLKDFKPLTLGTIKLGKGKQTFTLRAKEVIGTDSLEARMLILRRVR